MRRFAPALAGMALLAIAGCAGEEQPVVAQPPQPVVNVADRLSPGCYTVDLFDPYTIEAPTPDVPADATAFLGVWRNGAWNGDWCHDLYVTRIAADGSVEVLDAYGPWRAAGIEATVFRRNGHIDDGVLTFHSQGGTVQYRREGEYLVGSRRGTCGNMEITMSRQDGLVLQAGQSVTVQPKRRTKKS